MSKLYGKELEKELAARNEAKEKRRLNRITLREAAKANDMGLTTNEYIAWESGQDVCPHEEYEDMSAGVPIPKMIFKMCKKCHEVQEGSLEKVTEEHAERLHNIHKQNTVE